MGNPIVQDEPASPRGDDAVYVQLRGREGGDLYYKIRRQMPLGVLQEAYLSREKLDGVGVLFLYGGAWNSGDGFGPWGFGTLLDGWFSWNWINILKT